MKAIVIGATGATGKHLTEQLLNHPAFSQVTIFVRKPLAISHAKLTVKVIDFDAPEVWAQDVQGDVLFSCLGTTLKQAGSKENQYKIDHTYQYHFAKIAKENGIQHYVLISSEMANADAFTFYAQLKGKLDSDVLALNFPKISIFRPPLLVRENTDRFAEKMAEKCLMFANQLGLFQSARPLPTQKLAYAMINAVIQNQTGIVNKQTIWELAK